METKKILSRLSLLLMLVFLAFASSCTKDDDTSKGSNGTFTDSRDNIVYKTVTIGNQTWMAENLKFLPSVVGFSTGSETTPYYYVYGYNGTNIKDAKATTNYETYGVLYNFAALMAGSAGSTTNPSGVQGVCPSGWHLPSDDEFTELANYVGGYETAALKLKESGTIHWDHPNEGASDEFGFTALPGGMRYVNGNMLFLRTVGYWWTATEGAVESAIYFGMNNNSSDLIRGDGAAMEIAYSVRCVKD